MNTNVLSLSWKKTKKKVYNVWVCKPGVGTKVHNKLENVDYVVTKERPFVISGTVGEMWCISFDKLVKTYKFATGEPISLDGLKRRGTEDGLMGWQLIQTYGGTGEDYFASFLPIGKVKNFPVQTSWGDVLTANASGVSHGKGDFLLCPSNNGQPCLNDVWVVNGLVFPKTYSMNAFKGLIEESKLSGIDIPKPKKIGRLV
jgi:hypothetical protein